MTDFDADVPEVETATVEEILRELILNVSSIEEDLARVRQRAEALLSSCD